MSSPALNGLKISFQNSLKTFTLSTQRRLWERNVFIWSSRGFSLEAKRPKEYEFSRNFNYKDFVENILPQHCSFLSDMENESIDECLQRLNLPIDSRIDGEAIEYYVSALALRPNDKYDCQYHNIMCLMRETLELCHQVVKTKISIENEQELRDFMLEMFEIEKKFLKYIDLHFINLRYSPKEYLKRYIKQSQIQTNTIAIEKIMYHKYPKWRIHDNWMSCALYNINNDESDQVEINSDINASDT